KGRRLDQASVPALPIVLLRKSLLAAPLPAEESVSAGRNGSTNFHQGPRVGGCVTGGQGWPLF
ncbi:hypothetical protein JS562_45110, partial [Agrobacterium sp. S2]|nr:hypothetical protein [Agrobacterium sp. S2]